MPKTESVCDRGEHHKLEMSWSPNPAPNVLDLISFFPWTKSDVVSWWRMLGILVLGPQSTSLVLHAFHVSLTLFLIHVCISENDNEHTSWCSINSSNVSNTIMIKDYFTCESKIDNVVVSGQVMSSSIPCSLECEKCFPTRIGSPFRHDVPKN